MTDKKDLGRSLAMDGSGWLTRADSSGFLNKASQVKVRPAGPAPIVKAATSSETPPTKTSK